MSSRSERYVANAKKCRQYANAVEALGIKRLDNLVRDEGVAGSNPATPTN